MQPVTAVSLRALIDEALNSTDLTTPADIADEVIRRLPMKERAAALREVLPTFIRTNFSQRRMLNPLPEAAPTAPASSAKVAACRDQWAAQKATPLLVSGEWKRLGDCTAVDLLVVAADLRDRAARVAAKADWYEALAASLPSGATVDSLPEMPAVA